MIQQIRTFQAECEQCGLKTRYETTSSFKNPLPDGWGNATYYSNDWGDYYPGCYTRLLCPTCYEKYEQEHKK